MRRAGPAGTCASLRDRLRAQLADLKMPGALEGLDDLPCARSMAASSPPTRP